MKAFLKTKNGFSRWYEIKERTPIISIPNYSDMDFATPILSYEPLDVNAESQRKDFYREREFLNENDEIVGVYKER